jgi:2-keto-4-pentenoate hydratase
MPGETDVPSSDAERAALLLMGARQSGQRLADLPDDLQPATVAQAYAIQDAAMRHMGPIGGWKVSPLRPGADPGCAPVSAALIHASPAAFTLSEMPDTEIEVEIAVKLGRDLPARETSYEAADVRMAIATLHPAVELLGSRFKDRKAVSALSAVADSQSNAGIVLGEGLADWAGLDLGRVVMGLRIGGEEVSSTDGGADTANVLDSIAWLANHAASRNGGLKKGDVIITGARIGPWSVGNTATIVEAEVAGLGVVTITFK